MKYFFLLMLVLPTLLSAQQDCNCCTSSHEEFDFWIGEWAVHLQDGTLAGHNTISKEAGQCVLRENWKSAKGNFSGSSLNFYHPASGEWEQLWVDSSGTTLRLRGKLLNGIMVMKSEAAKNGSVNRIKWIPLKDGRVRQLWEILEEGKVKQVAFDGYYTRVK